MAKLAKLIPGYERNIGPKGMMMVMSSAGLALAGLMVLLYTLERLGLPGQISTTLLLGAITVSACLAAWLGRSVSGSLFFGAGRQGEALPVGLGGAFCWLSGAVIVTLFTLPQSGQFVIVCSMMLGLALQAFLFAGSINADNTSTLPGLMLSRHGARHAGPTCLVVCLLVLCPIIIAEFEVALELFSVLSGWSFANAALVVCALALLPTWLGGWQALLMVNVCMGIWISFSMLTPAIITGFVPKLMLGSVGAASLSLAPLAIGEQADLISSVTPLSTAIAMIVFAVGFAVLPHTLARLPLTSARITAVEGIGWAGLTIFLSLSALLLSVGLIVMTGAETGLGELLRSSAVLATLPYIAIFLAALNALSVTIFVLANSAVRTARYYRNREPGVGSMFAVRVLASLVAVAIWLVRVEIELAAPELFLIALAIAAGGLFSSVVVTTWFSSVPALAVSAAMSTGAITVLVGIVTKTYDIATSGALGLLASSVVLIAGRLLFARKSAVSSAKAKPAAV